MTGSIPEVLEPESAPRAPERATRGRRPLARFILRRLGAALIILLGITVVAFVLTRAVPNDPALANLGQNATQEQIDTYRMVHGLDDPTYVQYFRYMGDLLHGDLGVSQQTHNPVLTDLGDFVPATLELALLSTGIAVVLGVTFGVLATVYRNRWPDYLLRLVSLTGISIPSFWLALVMLYLFFFQFGLLPDGGRLDPGLVPPPDVTGMFTVDALLAGDLPVFGNALLHLVLPSLVLAAASIGVLTRYTRSATLDVIDQDYVRSARAQGLPGLKVLLGHVLRAALPAVLTMIGLLFANVLTGAVLVENIFSWPGLGKYGFQAATTLDLPAIMGVSLFVAFVYTTINLVVDVVHGILDPRIRVG